MTRKWHVPDAFLGFVVGAWGICGLGCFILSLGLASYEPHDGSIIWDLWNSLSLSIWLAPFAIAAVLVGLDALWEIRPRRVTAPITADLREIAEMPPLTETWR